MTPDELEKIANESSQKEYEQVIKSLIKEAEKGALSCGFVKISDAVVGRLESEGFTVVKDSLSQLFSENSYDYIVKFGSKGF